MDKHIVFMESIHKLNENKQLIKQDLYGYKVVCHRNTYKVKHIVSLKFT